MAAGTLQAARLSGFAKNPKQNCKKVIDRILVLDQGRLAESGTHAELLQARGLYAEMWARQQAERSD